MLKNILFVVACLTTTFACADSQANKSTTASEAINHVYDSIYQSFIEGDVSRIGDRFYTKDALFFPPSGGKYSGQQEITTVFQRMLSEGVRLKAAPEEIEVYGNVAYEWGRGNIYDREGNLLTTQNYVVIWKRAKGDWRIYRDFVQGVPAENK